MLPHNIADVKTELIVIEFDPAEKASKSQSFSKQNGRQFGRRRTVDAQGYSIFACREHGQVRHFDGKKLHAIAIKYPTRPFPPKFQIVAGR